MYEFQPSNEENRTIARAQQQQRVLTVTVRRLRADDNRLPPPIPTDGDIEVRDLRFNEFQPGMGAMLTCDHNPHVHCLDE